MSNCPSCDRCDKYQQVLIRVMCEDDYEVLCWDCVDVLAKEWAKK